MINSLLWVGLLVMGVGAKASTPINLNRQETTTTQKQKRNLQEENNSQLTFNHTFNLSTSSNVNSVQLNNTQNYTPTIDTPTYDVISYTNQPATYIDAITVQGQIRDENLILGKLDGLTPYYGIALPQQSNPTHETSSIWLFQITPTTYIVDSESTISLRINGAIHNWTVPDNLTININTNILVSTQETWAQYIGQAVNSTYRYNWQIYQDITSGTLGLNYSQWTYNNQFTVSSTDASQDYTIQTDININPSKINYLIVYQEPTVATNIYPDPYAIFEQAGNNTSSTYMFANFFNGNNERRYITFTGTYIVPPSNYEVIDLPGLMWQILSMPFSFISVAFNLTLFPGTPYQVNISNIIMAVFGVLVFIFIFKLILKK